MSSSGAGISFPNFNSQTDLEKYLERLGSVYLQYAPKLWEYGVRSVIELDHASAAALQEAGVTNNVHIDHIKASAAKEVSGAGTGAAPAVTLPSKKVLVVEAPSSLKDVKTVKAKGYIPAASDAYGNDRVAFYAGREYAVEINGAPPTLLCAPEFGIVHDSAHFAPAHAMAPSGDDVEAGQQLCKGMARSFETASCRQEVLIDWFNEHIASMGCRSIEVPSRGSSSSASESRTGANEGQIVTEVNGRKYLLAVLEVKNDSGRAGDPMFQALSYYQKFYRHGERWDNEPLLRATGAPAFTLELQGCDLVIGAVYTVEGNVVAREPLTDKMPLLSLGRRMRVYEERLARVLAAFRASVMLLDWRYQKMAGGAGLRTLEDLASTALCRLPAAARTLATAAVAAATLTAEDIAAARLSLEVEVKQHPIHRRPWARLPYPLAPCSVYPSVESLPNMATKAVFKCIMAGEAGGTSRFVHVKFQQRPYPEQVHTLLHGRGLTPRCIDVRRLPGGWWMVVQECLDASWSAFNSLQAQWSAQQQEAAFNALLEAVEAMHTAGADGKPIVHGDLRPPNVMLKETTPGKFEVRLVDVEWAGFEGEATYPLNMAPRSRQLPWHHTAEPGEPLLKEHDQHLLNILFKRT